jgi:uncharacterized membrane protein
MTTLPARCFTFHVLLVSVLTVPAHAAQLAYRYTEIGQGTAFAVNDAGTVGGLAAGEGFLWTEADGFTRTFGTGSRVNDVNNAGAAVGTDPSGGVVWGADGTPTPLPGVTPHALNNSGLVVGGDYRPVGSTQGQAFRWDAQNGLADLGVLAPGRESRANAVSSNGVIVGFGGTNDGSASAVIWSNGTAPPVAIPNPDGLGGFNTAFGANDDGLVVGLARGPSGGRAVKWQDGTPVVLPNLADGVTDSAAHAVNAEGIIGGFSTVDGENRATIWVGNEVLDLNLLVNPYRGDVRLEIVNAISDTGYVTGTAIVDSQTRAFLLTPIPFPEPSGLVMLLAGGLLLRVRSFTSGGFYLRRR